MSTEIDLERKVVADRFREEYPESLCSQDDARLTTVTFNSDAPEWLLEEARREAADIRGEIEDTAGQVGLTEHERQQIDFTKGRASVPHARAVKGIAADAGVDDWLAHYDSELTVDEHRDVMARAAREGGGRRMDSEDSAEVQAGRAARTAESEECDHARGHCKHGDPDACEFLQERCDVDEDRVALLLEGDVDDSGTELSGEDLAALSKAWDGYKGAIAGLDSSIDSLVEDWEHAQQAAKAVNAIRRRYGQDPLHFEALEAAQAQLADFARRAGSDCIECHADHSGHDHGGADRETLADLVDEPPGGTE